MTESTIVRCLSPVNPWNWQCLQRHCCHDTLMEIYLEKSRQRPLLTYLLCQCLIYFPNLWILITCVYLTTFGSDIFSEFFVVPHPGFCTLTYCCCCMWLLYLRFLLEIRWLLWSLMLWLIFEFQSSNQYCNLYGPWIANQEWYREVNPYHKTVGEC